MGSGLNTVRIEHFRFFQAGFPRMFSAYESSVQEPLVVGKKFLNRTVLGQVLQSNKSPTIFTHGKTLANRISRRAVPRHLARRQAEARGSGLAKRHCIQPAT